MNQIPKVKVSTRARVGDWIRLRAPALPQRRSQRIGKLGRLFGLTRRPHRMRTQRAALCAPHVFPGARVLVVGAGRGTDAIYCAQHFPEAQVTALDLSPTMLAQLDRRRRKEIPQATNLTLVGGR